MPGEGWNPRSGDARVLPLARGPGTFRWTAGVSPLGGWAETGFPPPYPFRGRREPSGRDWAPSALRKDRQIRGPLTAPVASPRSRSSLHALAGVPARLQPGTTFLGPPALRGPSQGSKCIPLVGKSPQNRKEWLSHLPPTDRNVTGVSLALCSGASQPGEGMGISGRYKKKKIPIPTSYFQTFSFDLLEAASWTSGFLKPPQAILVQQSLGNTCLRPKSCVEFELWSLFVCEGAGEAFRTSRDR